MRGLVGLVPDVGEVRQALGVPRSVQMKGVRAEGEVYRVLERCLGARDRLESRIRSIA